MRVLGKNVKGNPDDADGGGGAGRLQAVQLCEKENCSEVCTPPPPPLGT